MKNSKLQSLNVRRYFSKYAFDKLINIVLDSFIKVKEMMYCVQFLLNTIAAIIFFHCHQYYNLFDVSFFLSVPLMHFTTAV